MVGIAAMILLVAAWLIAPTGEPMCDGRRLTQWMAALGSADQDEEAHAFAAIETIGTNGLQIILPRLGTRDSAWRFQVLTFIQRAPLLHIHFTTPSELRQRAKMALMLAGEESMRASIPELVRLSGAKDPGVRLTAVELLSAFPINDPAPLAALKGAEADADPRVRAAAQQALGIRRAVEQEARRLRQLEPKAASGNGAMTLRFQIQRHCRAVPEQRCSPSV
jgi:hypothetical protein